MTKRGKPGAKPAPVTVTMTVNQQAEEQFQEGQQHPGPFDRKLEIHQGRLPARMEDGLVDVNDTLEFCYAISRQVFGPALALAHPELVLGIYDRVLVRRKRWLEKAGLEQAE